MNETRRVAIVTGGSRGIGRETVSRLAADGFAVTVVYAGRAAEADAAVEEVTGKGGRAIAVQADVADEQAVATVFDRTEQEFGGVDVVVNAAGVMNDPTPLTDMSLDEFDRIHRTNVRGTFVVSQQAARRVRTGGAIINFSTSVTEQSAVDRRLTELGHHRRAALSVPYHTAAVLAVPETQLVATLPARVLSTLDNPVLRVVAAPPEIEPMTFLMTWHARVDDDPAQRWLRDLVRVVAAET
jgi:NAD(P)-dependent dehydrogenase (short-subunit alcohol dehydrogenase family)